MSEEMVTISFQGEARVTVSQTKRIPKRMWLELKQDSDQDVDDYLSDITDWRAAHVDTYHAEFDELCVVDEHGKFVEHLRD